MSLPTVLEQLVEILRAVRVADAIDVALIAVLLYGLLMWFRETTSRSVYVGLSILALIYLLARAFDMYLTALVFQGVFAVLLVALVVVFQEDLRRVFERLANIGSIRNPDDHHVALARIAVLVETATDLARRKIGGLIVVKGREPLERHIDGGIELDGRISRPLLESIFDPHSMGHDGAVIIENDRISLFAAHLPLSKNARQIGSRGTRHSAALGIAEVSDALVVVVSEERGEVSVARAGQFSLNVSATELQGRLERFREQTAPRRPRRVWQRMLKKHAGLKAASLLLACLAWYFVSYQAVAGSVQQTFVVPIEFRNVPQGIVFEDPPSTMRVTLSGPERAFDLLVTSTLKVSLDLGQIQEGSHRLPLVDENVKRPSTLAVYQLEPRVLSLNAHSLVPVELKVRVRTAGRLPKNFEIRELQPRPRSIRAMVWKSQRTRFEELRTMPIELSEIRQTTTVPAQIDLPEAVRFVDGKPPELMVTIVVVPKPPESGQ